MEFGTGLGMWQVFVPKWRGNRDLPIEKRCSVEIRLLRPVDRMAAGSWTPERAIRWRDERLSRLLDDPEYGDALRALDPDTLRVLEFIDRHTRHWRGFMFDGEEVTDAVELCMRLDMPQAPEVGIMQEVREAITEASQLSGDDLVRFVSSFAGSGSATSGAQTDEPTVQLAPDRAS